MFTWWARLSATDPAIEGLGYVAMDELQGGGQLTFRDYVRVLWRRRWLIVLTVIVAVGASVVYDILTTPVYSATSQLELTPQLSSALLQANNASSQSSAAIVDVPTDIQIIQSASVRNAVLRKLPLSP